MNTNRGIITHHSETLTHVKKVILPESKIKKRLINELFTDIYIYDIIS